jgi:hypothetical protein
LKLIEFKLLGSLKKWIWGLVEFSFLGHKICHSQILWEDTHMGGVVEWLRQNISDNMRKFMGNANYLRKFIPMYATYASPLTDLLTPRYTQFNCTSNTLEK